MAELGDRRMIEPNPTEPSGARSGSTATVPRGNDSAMASNAACEIEILTMLGDIGPMRADASRTNSEDSRDIALPRIDQ
jgi:hypothetical protein